MAIAIYHITHVDNLPRIIETNGLWCDTERVRQEFTSVGIAHANLKQRRMRREVVNSSGRTIAAGGFLADYVPFYFANRSPMLFSIHTGCVEGYNEGQTKVVYLVSSVEKAMAGDRSCCFTNGHGVEAVTDFFDDVNELAQLDWTVINHWSWKNTEQDPDRKRRKQAEFLVHRSVPWNWFELIGVCSESMQRHVTRILDAAGHDHRPTVQIQRKWYY